MQKIKKFNEKMNSKSGVRCMTIRAKASRWFFWGADKIVNIVMGSSNILLLLDEKAKAQKREGDARPASDARESHEAQGEEGVEWKEAKMLIYMKLVGPSSLRNGSRDLSTSSTVSRVITFQILASRPCNL